MWEIHLALQILSTPKPLMHHDVNRPLAQSHAKPLIKKTWKDSVLKYEIETEEIHLGKKIQ